MKHLIALAAIFLAACAGNETADLATIAPAAGAQKAEFVEDVGTVIRTPTIGPNFADYVPNATCNGLSYFDFGSQVDGPAYYVDAVSYAVKEICGGACMGGTRTVNGVTFCGECPPKAWTCESPPTDKSRPKPGTPEDKAQNEAAEDK